MTDRLDAIAATLDIVPERDIDDWQMAYSNGHRTGRVTGRDLRWLVDEVRRLRQRHAEVVEAAFKEGYCAGGWPNATTPDALDAAWLASEAKARLI